MRDIQSILNLAVANGYSAYDFMCHNLDRLADKGYITREESDFAQKLIGKFIQQNQTSYFTTLNSAITFQAWFIKNPDLASARDLKELGPLKIAIYSHWYKRQEIIETGPTHPLVQKYINLYSKIKLHILPLLTVQ